MATYDEIHGKRVEVFSSDPTLGSSYEGQVWFNSTSGINKTLVTLKAWTSGGNLPLAKRTQGCGTQTAGLTCLGYTPSPGYQVGTEEYDGTSWTASNNANTARNLIAVYGIQTACVAAGGIAPPNPPFNGVTNSEIYNGTNWTNGPTLNTARYGDAAAGTSTAGVVFGGYSEGYPGYIALTEEFDGSSYSESGDLATARHYLGGTGTQTAAVAVGGSQPPPTSALVENYDGSSWTSGTNIPAGTSNIRASGTQTLNLAFAGYNTALSVKTYAFDGTAWSNFPNMSTARQEGGNSTQGGVSTAFMAGGEEPSMSNKTEEFTAKTTTTIAAAWASGGNMNQQGEDVLSFGTQTAAVAGPRGNGPGDKNETEEYNGTSWSDTPATLTPARYAVKGAGTQTAGLAIGGYN